MSVESSSHVEIPTQVWALEGRPPLPRGCPGYPLPCLGVIETPWFALRSDG